MKLLIFIATLALVRGQEEVCCDGIGCFSNAPPFDHLPLPDCPTTDGVNNAPHFNLFTRSNRDSGQEITRTNIPSEFDGSKRTVFLTHGWWGSREDSYLYEAKDRILEFFDNNVIVLGWGEGSVSIDYWWAASNTRVVGAEAAYISNQLITQAGSSADRLWCIGHSLGSHACGHYGKKAQELFSFTPGRITGLDPAGPWFDGYAPPTGLWNTDARFVDTIITDRGALGTESGQRGDANFFPNGGTGDHFICWEYIYESFNDVCRFNAREICSDVNDIPGSCGACGSEICQVMGEPSAADGRSGMFHLTTWSTPPYCSG